VIRGRGYGGGGLATVARYPPRGTFPILGAGGDQVRTKVLRILYSGAALATLLLAAGAKWKGN
jgi:hypothetical protein